MKKGPRVGLCEKLFKAHKNWEKSEKKSDYLYTAPRRGQITTKLIQNGDFRSH